MNQRRRRRRRGGWSTLSKCLRAIILAAIKDRNAIERVGVQSISLSLSVTITSNLALIGFTLRLHVTSPILDEAWREEELDLFFFLGFF